MPSHPRSYYKSDRHYLDAIYRKNKTLIDTELSGGSGSPRTTFKTIVNEYLEEGKTIRQSLRIIDRSELFTPRLERLQSNALKTLRRDEKAWEAFSELRSKRNERGQFTKIDTSKMKWDKKQKVYIYNNELIISFKNSPKTTIVKKI